ncbi:leucyl aminopeptidase [Loktanella fryxellensis]|uniref:Probable cytosol aminopeptidase n=1 Tax=Loktanella fryxellensis TaxID=245187 RepID=A0A1H8F6S2_9RHOB|nr:leucyl aminopeptidase [Loktanella fryxellensis]SEN26837.1 leucyl aminopeptidase [Loktanella fryxellensis]
MTQIADIRFLDTDLDALAATPGLIAVLVAADGRMDAGARKINGLTRKALSRLADTDAFGRAKTGDVFRLGHPAGLIADAVLVVKSDGKPDQTLARRIGANLARLQGGLPLCVVLGKAALAQDVALGLALRGYAFTDYKTDKGLAPGAITLMVADPEGVAKAAHTGMAVAEGVFFTRDLTNEPANVLTTDDFAARLAAMQDLGLEVEILEEAELKALGMGALLAVGQGSASPSKVVVMQWRGAGDAAPFALVGKGVVFDTGGISLKPGAGMEDMTMDMGGAAVVAGVMRTLALRKARANVVGLVGLVENMPSGTAYRPGDVLTSMKGDTIEVINTDAEGRLVLADVLWYAQDRFKPVGMINLATLTGAILIALGHEHAGVFSNDDALADAFLAAAKAEGEGAWRLPLTPAYDRLIDSGIADMKNTGGRTAGSITAAQFLKRFVKDDVPWCHLDIAGMASVKHDTPLAPKGATGWGVMALNRLIADRFEG